MSTAKRPSLLLGGLPNRVVTSREQKEILCLIEQDERELSRLQNELNELEKRTADPQRRVQDYRKVLAIAEALHAVTKRKHQSAVESANELGKLDLGAILSVAVDDENLTRDQRNFLVDEAMLEKAMAVTEVESSAGKLGLLDVRIRDIKRAIEGEECILSMLEISKGGIRESLECRETQLSVKRSAVSFRRAVPMEIWEEIFHLAIIEEELKFCEDRRHGTPPFPTLKLAAVCRYWRTIIIHRPKLWRYVAIPHYKMITASQKDRIVYYAERLSKLSPLAYTYRHDFEGGSFPVDFFDFVRKTFTDYGTLELLLPETGWWRGATLRRLLDDLSAQIDVLRMVAYDYAAPTSLSLATLQKIKQLEFNGAEVEYTGGTGVTTSITSFCIRRLGMDHSRLRQWLNVMPSLKDFKFSSSTFSPEGEEKVTLASLTTLECDLDQYPNLVEAISAPKLHAVILEYQSDDDLEIWEEYTADSVRSLTIRASPTAENVSEEGEESFLPVFKCFEGITHLTLDGAKITSLLQSFPTTEAPLANLQHLTVTNSDVDESALSAFIERFKDLNDGGFTLSTEACSDLDVDAIQRLRAAALDDVDM